MSEKECKFVDNNPENQKPHNISGKNPRSVQNLHKAQVKPRSQDKDVTIEFVDSEETTYRTKTTYLVQKAKMQLKRRVAPGISEIIVRKNEEKRKLKEEKAKVEKAEVEKAEVEKEPQVQEDADVKAKVEKEMEKQEEKVSQRKTAKKEEEYEQAKAEAKEKINEAVEEAKVVVDETKEKIGAKIKEVSGGKSFTQALREQGLIKGQKISEAIEKAKPVVEAKVEEVKTKVEETVEEAKTKKEETVEETPKEETVEETAVESDGLSFTQYLRDQGLIETGAESSPELVEEEDMEETSVVEDVKEEDVKETPVSDDTTDGKSFTQSLREQGLIATEDSVSEKEVVETVEEINSEEKDEAEEKEDSDSEAKTFIDLIREEGLL